LNLKKKERHKTPALTELKKKKHRPERKPLTENAKKKERQKKPRRKARKERSAPFVEK
jgi:hypothetical protein